MQLGLTIPLRRYLKTAAPPIVPPREPAFCWELHRVRRAGRDGLIAVNAHSRYAVYLHGMRAADWARFDALALGHIRLALEAEDLPPAWIDRYFRAAGAPMLTKTHGRSPVAYLNKAVDRLQFFDYFDDSRLEQPMCGLFLNEAILTARDFPEPGTPREFLRHDFARLFSD